MEQKGWFEKFGNIVTKIGTIIMMNLLFLVCCIPVVTIGQAWCALLTALRYQIRGDSWWDGFKFGFKTRFLRGTLAWCILLAVDVIMLLDVMQYTAAEVSMIYPVMACVMFALMTMLTSAFLILNVYIPTPVGKWIHNATAMVFKAPLQLLVASAIVWAPVLLAIFWFDIFYYVIMIFLVAYFALAALASTMLLKDALIVYLLDARATGTLLAEEGGAVKKEERSTEGTAARGKREEGKRKGRKLSS